MSQIKSELLQELQHAHHIIRNGLNIMTSDQKVSWMKVNEQTGCSGEGATRYYERQAVIDKAIARIFANATNRKNDRPGKSDAGLNDAIKLIDAIFGPIGDKS